MLLIKMLKDLKQNITQFLAIFVMSFISLVVVAGLGVSDYAAVDDYMVNSDFKDLDLSGISFTVDDINSIANLEDIAAVDGYYNTSGKMELNKTAGKMELNKTAGQMELNNTSGKMELSEDVKVLISYITSNDVSKLYITDGVPYAPGEPGVWVDKNIAQAKGIKVGDNLNIISEDVRFSEEVKGLCYSPQYIYYAVDSTYTEPDYTKYGFLFMDISRYPGSELYFDELLVNVSGVNGQLNLSKSDRQLLGRAKHKIISLIDSPALAVNEKPEDYQLKTYVEAVGANKLMQLLFPFIFGAIAMLGILTTMTRLIARQRSTIGALKALGFTGKTITLHYMSYSLVIVLLGCVSGAVAGYYTLGPVMDETMIYYYLNPFNRMEVSGVIFIFIGILAGGAALVSYVSNARVLKLGAAQILQPQAPPASGKSWYESLGLWSRLKFATQWNVRDISQNPFRTLMSILGVVVCSSLIFSSFGFYECLKSQGFWQYGQLIIAKNKVELSEDAGYGTAYDYAKEYKGQLVQASPIRLRYGAGEKNSNMYIVDEGANYFLHDKDGNYVRLPQRGVAITKNQMERTGLSPGDTISWNIIGEKDIYTAVITEMVRTPLDQGIYMTREVYEGLRGNFEPRFIYTGLSVPKDIEERSEIISVNTIKDLKAGMDSGNANYVFIVAIMVILALLLGSVILYNLGSMSYNEKQKDMATLKVLGFRSGGLKLILMQQNLIITGIGAILGIFLGFQVLDVLTTIFGEDVDCLIILSAMPYIVNFGFTFVLSAIVNLFITSRLDELDMVEALKGV